MSIKWDVLEEEQEISISDEEYLLPQQKARRWRRWFLSVVGLLLLVTSVGVGVFQWQVYQQEQRLWADLAVVIEAEARAQAFGLQDEADRFVDPESAMEWRKRYAELFSVDSFDTLGWFLPPMFAQWYAPEALPELRSVKLEQSGQRVVVQVAWLGRSQVLEQRAYRLVNQRWQRSPLHDELEEPAHWLSTSSDHFVWEAHPDMPEAMEGATALLLELEGLQAGMAATWPEELLRHDERQLTLRVMPLELETLIINHQDENLLLINSANFALYYPQLPLSMSSQQRYALGATASEWLLSLFDRTGHKVFNNDDPRANIYLFLLTESDAQGWMLNDSERKALRQAWREDLGQAWLSPLAFPDFGGSSNEEGSESNKIKNWLLSSRLFVEQLRVEQYITHPGDVAHAMLEHQAQGFDATLVELTGLTIAELEAKARDYALTQEE